MNRYHKFFAVMFCGAVLAVASDVSAAMTGVLPIIGNGGVQDWAVVGAPSNLHFDAVNELPCNGNTDFVVAAPTTTSSRETFWMDLAGVPDGATINKIHISPCASSGTGASSTMDVFAVYNGVSSPDVGNYAVVGTVPATLSTATLNNANIVRRAGDVLEIGAVYTSGLGGVRLSRIHAVIEYTP
jgi:hypothetical protein